MSLKRQVYWISTYMFDNYICNVAAAKFERARSRASELIKARASFRSVGRFAPSILAKKRVNWISTYMPDSF